MSTIVGFVVVDSIEAAEAGMADGTAATNASAMSAMSDRERDLFRLTVRLLGMSVSPPGS
jgi:hypothetical protein